jgi:hypothetical protein
VDGVRLVASELCLDVPRHDRGVLHRVGRHFGVGEVGYVADGVDVVVALDVQVLGDRDHSLVGQRRQMSVRQIAGVDLDAECAEPDVGNDLLTSVGGDDKAGGLAGRYRRQCGQASAQPQFDAALVELMVQAVAYLGQEPGKQSVGPVDDDHALVRPDVLDLAGQLQADRAGAEDQVIAPLMNKIRGFLLRPFVRAAIAGGTSTVDMDEVLNTGGICLVRIARDALGMETARLVGSIVVARTWQAATRRARRPAAATPRLRVVRGRVPQLLELGLSIGGHAR